MVLYIHSDASYLSESRARSRAAGHFFLSSQPLDPTKPPVNIPVLNGPIHTLCQIIDVVVGSAAESEIGSGYLNGQAAVPIVITLGELGHNQPATPMQVDNTTAEGFANDTIKQKRSKAMDMRWRWLQDRVRQGQFLVYFRPGITNMADPFTKHKTPAQIKILKPNFVLTSRTEALAQLVVHNLARGCVNLGRVRTSTVHPRLPNQSHKCQHQDITNIGRTPFPSNPRLVKSLRDSATRKSPVE